MRAIEFYKITKEASLSPNGDACQIYENEYNTLMILSDGMGHTSKSKDISEYLIELVNYLFLISNNAQEAIESANQIILAKTYEEVYATLDFCEFDLELGKMSIFKAGSFPTYLIRNKTINCRFNSSKCFSKYSLFPTLPSSISCLVNIVSIIILFISSVRLNLNFVNSFSI